jgi:hypothetical protein
MLFSFPTEKILEKEQRQIFLRRLFRRVFLEDWGTKLIALGITAALWLGVTGLRAPVTKRITNVALNLSYSSEMELVNSPITEVDLVVTGDKSKLDRLRREDLIVSVDLSEVKPGERTIQLTPENINVELPNGLKIEEIQPNKIAVKLERVEERDVAVKPETEGALPEGFEIYSRTVAPPTVRVRGPESFVRALDSISTEKISLENQRAGFTARQVELNVVNPKIRLLDTIVDVTFNIGERRMEAVFSVPYESEGVSRKARVILFAPNSILEQIKPEELMMELSRAESGEIKPNLILPADLRGKVEVRNIKLN